MGVGDGITKVSLRAVTSQKGFGLLVIRNSVMPEAVLFYAEMFPVKRKVTN